ncbi:EAL domain-containing protein [Pseudoalteromonas tunicata]|uniref:EAL domain-containing protein n=1 Tax=Pseudoalteromonas tunicata TaxID=314281 RepID=UPI00273E35E4|nr:EAL domain-containing protein [Pseudoalteromonas tunicata]MDP4983757.1 EAL domain-containing protein [Pseudoalteromonas tunicata]MDP5214273.1 EAL domain-containing protein [Pseudoalteromonas tunicata]
MSGQLKLLLINSNLKQRNLIKRALLPLNVFELLEVRDSRSALTLLKQHAVDLIITGLDIGKIDGWRFARMVRSGLLKTPKNTPILLTPPTYCERIAETTARAYGIDAVLAYEQINKLPRVLANVLSSHLTKSSRLELLLVEPETPDAEQISYFLRESFHITHVTNEKVAIELFGQHHFAIVLIDTIHNKIDAQNLVQRLLATKPNQAVVMIIDNQEADFAEQLLLSGVTDFARTPYNESLLNRICHQAARREDFMASYAEFAEKVEQLSQSQSRYKELYSAHQRILQHLNTVVLELNSAGQILFINPAWEKLTGLSLKQVINKPLAEFCSPETQALVSNAVSQIMLGQIQQKKFELKLQHQHGHAVWAECRMQSIVVNKVTVGVTASIDNIHERKQAELQLHHLAHHDTLTKLHNRYYFDLKLNQLCKDTKDSNAQHALIYIDLDHFKIINDSQGHHQGDIVLKQIAKTFQKNLHEGSTICRIGGDEFAVILENVELLEAHLIAEGLCHAVENYQFQAPGQQYSISCSIGLTLITANNSDASECLKQSDIALYVAKNRGRNLVHCYTYEDADSNKKLAELAWAHQVRSAMLQDQLEIHFQPIWGFKEQQVAYFEALSRLRVDGQLIYPNRFIPALELIADINLLDHCVVKKAIAYAGQSTTLNKIAINLSAQAFSDEGLLTTIEEALKSQKVDPTRIVFEITESASISNLTATRLMIEKLNQLGCSFSIDDFGTGFSTFSYLKQLPANQVKIDGSFVKDMINDPIDKALVNAIKDISHSLQKTCVAEFVENKETFDSLRKIGVDYAQGYLISRPLPFKGISQAIKKINADKTFD